MEGQEILNWNGKITRVTPQPNNVRNYFELGYTSTSTISIDGSLGEKSSYRLSYVDLRNKGISPNSNFARNSISFRSITEVMKNLDFDLKANYIFENALNRTGVGDARTGARTFIWMPRSTNIQELKDDYMTEDGYELNWYEADPWHTNPYWESYKNTNYDNKDRLISSASFGYTIIPGLKFTLRGGLDFYKARRYVRIANKSLREPKGSYSERWIAYKSINVDGFFTYEKKLSEDFSLNLVAGVNRYTSEVDMNSSSIVDFAIPDFYSLNNYKDKANTSFSTLRTKKMVNAAYGSAEIAFRNFWFVDITGRNDWASTLPSGNNSYFYPSINTSLVITDILGLKDSFWDFGKIRLSWANVGNDAEPYKLYNYYLNSAYSSYPTNYILSTRNLPYLEPENTVSKEIGTDLRFFENRIGLDMTLYTGSTTSQIMTSEVSKTTGFAKAVINAGEIKNKGIEMVLTLKPVRTTVVDWAVTLNFTKNKTNVISLAPGIETIQITGESQITVEARPGHPFGDIIGSTIKRYYKTDTEGNVIPDPNNGKPLLDDQGLYVIDTDWKVIGNITPDWTGGIVNEFAYKNLSLCFTIGVKMGGDIFSKTNKYGLDNGQFVQTLPGRASWYASNTAEKLAGRKGEYNPDGTPLLNEFGDQVFSETSEAVGYVPSGVYADGTTNKRGIDPQVYWHQYKWGGIGELSVYDASYVKLREVIIGYNFPKAWMKKGFIKSASVSFVGRNLWLIYSGVPNIDPEVSFSSKENGLGQEYASLPTLRSVGINLKVNF
jgi:hypothetical protein